MSATSFWIWVAVAAAGSLGAMARFWIGRVIGTRQLTSVKNRLLRPDFPLGILIANTLACLLIGSVAGHTGVVALLITTGLCGGLSTMSTLAVGTLTLWDEVSRRQATYYVALTLVTGVIAFWLGRGAGLLLGG